MTNHTSYHLRNQKNIACTSRPIQRWSSTHQNGGSFHMVIYTHHTWFLSQLLTYTIHWVPHVLLKHNKRIKTRKLKYSSFVHGWGNTLRKKSTSLQLYTVLVSIYASGPLFINDQLTQEVASTAFSKLIICAYFSPSDTVAGELSQKAASFNQSDTFFPFEDSPSCWNKGIFPYNHSVWQATCEMGVLIRRLNLRICLWWKGGVPSICHTFQAVSWCNFLSLSSL